MSAIRAVVESIDIFFIGAGVTAARRASCAAQLAVGLFGPALDVAR
jgi:hypothetical protein